MTQSITIEEKKNEIIVYSDTYNNDKVYQNKIDEALIKALKR